MKSGEDARNRTFAALRQQVVLREDGRYLIYYSLPADMQRRSDSAAGGTRAQAPAPAQRPWSPDREPDV